MTKYYIIDYDCPYCGRRGHIENTLVQPQPMRCLGCHTIICNHCNEFHYCNQCAALLTRGERKKYSRIRLSSNFLKICMCCSTMPILPFVLFILFDELGLNIKGYFSLILFGGWIFQFVFVAGLYFLSMRKEGEHTSRVLNTNPQIGRNIPSQTYWTNQPVSTTSSTIQEKSCPQCGKLLAITNPICPYCAYIF
jgi:hypothetical protein